MEKLQPVIRQIFWVLFGLGLILILWGWYAANSSLSASIETEKGKVETTKTGAKKNVIGTPSPDWTDKAAKLNDKHSGAFDESADKLWKQQLAARVYPDLIGAEINQLRFRSKIRDKSVRGIFRTLYNGYFLEQLAVIKPFKPETGQGLVDVANAQITRENPTKWKTRLPTSQEIWNAQEDIWLVRSLLDAIAETNGAADRIDKAPIRSLLQLQLRGGDPEAKAGESAAGGSEGGMEGMSGFGGPGMSGMGGGMSGMGGGVGAAAGGAWSSFKGSLTTDLLTEEFGPAPGAPLGGMMGGMMGGGEDDYSGGGGGGSGSTGSEEEDADSTADRYVHYGEELPYKTRAFILSVKMIQKDIPSLLASLPNGKFPVEIVRVDVDFSGGSSNSSGGGMSGMGGMGMGEGEGEGYGGGLSGGFGGGMGGPGLGGPGMGGLGMGGSGMGRGGLGGGFGAPGKGKAKTRKEMKRASDGMGVFEDAMNFPLATVRVAGLMTIYESTEEKAAEAEADNAAETEVNDAAEGGLPELDLDPGETGTDPSTTAAGDGAGSDATGTATSESETIDLASPPSDGANGTDINQNGTDANGGNAADGSNGKSMELPPPNTPNESGTNPGSDSSSDAGNTELPKPGTQTLLRQNLDFKSFLEHKSRFTVA